MKAFFNILFKRDEEQALLTYVDIGAMGGIAGYWRQLAEHCHVIAFEADEREFAKLKSSTRVTYLPYVVYHSSQPVRFYISRHSGKSSLYKPNQSFLKDFPDAARYDVVQEVEVPKEKVKTLDQVLSQEAIPQVDFIKIDTQGSELDILKGASGTLEHVIGLEVEVEFSSLYQGQPLFRDVDAYLDTHGFQLIDLRRCLWKKKSFFSYIGRGQLVFADALYFKRVEFLLATLLKQEDTRQRVNKIRKMVAICMVYRLPDYAVDLLDKALAQGLMDEAEYERLSRCVKEEAARWGKAQWWGRSLLSKIANRCSEELKPASHLGWSDGDRFIGNTRNI